MIISRFGIRLVRIAQEAASEGRADSHETRQEDLEQVRCWRNLPRVREQMIFREVITPEMQRAWFAALDPAKNYYFFIEAGGVRVGVINLKDVEAKSGEWGIYIVDEERGALSVIKSAVAILDFAFDDLGLEVVRATVLPTNERALRMNAALGMSQVGKTSAALQYELTPAEYRVARSRFAAVLR